MMKNLRVVDKGHGCKNGDAGSFRKAREFYCIPNCLPGQGMEGEKGVFWLFLCRNVHAGRPVKKCSIFLKKGLAI